jgi:hypothetical protein
MTLLLTLHFCSHILSPKFFPCSWHFASAHLYFPLSSYLALGTSLLLMSLSQKILSLLLALYFSSHIFSPRTFPCPLHFAFAPVSFPLSSFLANGTSLWLPSFFFPCSWHFASAPVFCPLNYFRAPGTCMASAPVYFP